MKIITRTSTYELTRDPKGFKLVKTAITLGCYSTVAVGQTFYSPEPWLNEANGLEFGGVHGGMHTSPITNADEVRKFLES
jgi:hypothetical protein